MYDTGAHGTESFHGSSSPSSSVQCIFMTVPRYLLGVQSGIFLVCRVLNRRVRVFTPFFFRTLKTHIFSVLPLNPCPHTISTVCGLDVGLIGLIYGSWSLSFTRLVVSCEFHRLPQTVHLASDSHRRLTSLPRRSCVGKHIVLLVSSADLHMFVLVRCADPRHGLRPSCLGRSAGPGTYD